MNTNLLAVPQFAVEQAIEVMKAAEQIGGSKQDARSNARVCLEMALREGTPEMSEKIYGAIHPDT
jgi:hypothetical protein